MAGLAGARVIPMAAAGFGGAALFQNSEKAMEYVADLLRLILGQVDRLGGSGGGAGGIGDPALLEKLNALASKVDVALLNARQPMSPTVVVRDGGGSGSGAKVALASLAALGAYAKLKGFSLSDLKPVTAKTLGVAMGTVGKSLNSVSELVTTVKSALQERIDKVSQSVDDVDEKIDHVHDELGVVDEKVDNVQDELSVVHGEVTSMQDDVTSMREVQEDSAQKIEYTARGIHALCGVVSELLKNASQTPAIANLQNFTLIGTKTSLPRPPLSRGSSAPPAIVPAADEELDDTLSSTDLKEAIKNIEALGAKCEATQA